jgi:hypothetical protein
VSEAHFIIVPTSEAHFFVKRDKEIKANTKSMVSKHEMTHASGSQNLGSLFPQQWLSNEQTTELMEGIFSSKILQLSATMEGCEAGSLEYKRAQKHRDKIIEVMTGVSEHDSLFLTKTKPTAKIHRPTMTDCKKAQEETFFHTPPPSSPTLFMPIGNVPTPLSYTQAAASSQSATLLQHPILFRIPAPFAPVIFIPYPPFVWRRF